MAISNGVFDGIVLVYLIVAMCLVNRTIKKNIKEMNVEESQNKMKILFGVFISFIGLICLSHIVLGNWWRVICKKFVRYILGLYFTIICDFLIILPILGVLYYEARQNAKMAE